MMVWSRTHIPVTIIVRRPWTGSIEYQYRVVGLSQFTSCYCHRTTARDTSTPSIPPGTSCTPSSLCSSWLVAGELPSGGTAQRDRRRMAESHPGFLLIFRCLIYWTTPCLHHHLHYSYTLVLISLSLCNFCFIFCLLPCTNSSQNVRLLLLSSCSKSFGRNSGFQKFRGRTSMVYAGAVARNPASDTRARSLSRPVAHRSFSTTSRNINTPRVENKRTNIWFSSVSPQRLQLL